MWRLFLLVGGCAAAFAAGMHTQSRLDAGTAVKQVIRTVTVVQKQGVVNAQVATKVQAAQDQIRYVTRDIIKEIPVAVPSSADPVLGNGWVRLHDAAALGVPAAAESAAQPDDAASDVDAAQALTTVVSNYARANSCITQLTGWQEWAKAQGLSQ